MNVVVLLLSVLIAIFALFAFTLVLSFYHFFESNKQTMDKYALASVIVFGILFYALMRGVILKW